MESALRGQAARDFQRPEGLVEVEVCALSGSLPGPACPHRVTELFLKGTEPVETCTMHQRIALDRATGLRATAATPPEEIVERIYTLLPPAAQAWARDQGILEPPPMTEESGLHSSLAPEASGVSLVMTNPDEGAVYRLDPALPRDAQQIVISARLEAGRLPMHIELLVDGEPLARIGAPPYEVLWPLKPGAHRFSAVGEYADGKQVVSRDIWIKVRD
jgi:penicillin-binding protein 1C